MPFRTDWSHPALRAVVGIFSHRGAGRGFMVTPDTVVTCRHCLYKPKGPDRLYKGLTIETAAGRVKLKHCTILAHDDLRDIAVVRLPRPLPTAVLPLAALAVTELPDDPLTLRQPYLWLGSFYRLAYQLKVEARLEEESCVHPEWEANGITLRFNPAKGVEEYVLPRSPPGTYVTHHSIVVRPEVRAGTSGAPVLNAANQVVGMVASANDHGESCLVHGGEIRALLAQVGVTV